MKKFLIAFLLVCVGIKPMYADADRCISMSCEKDKCSLFFVRDEESKTCKMTDEESDELYSVFEKYIPGVGYRNYAIKQFVSLYSSGITKESFMKVCDIAFAELLQQNKKDEMVNKCVAFYTDLLNLYFKSGVPCSNKMGNGVYVVSNGVKKCRLKRCSKSKEAAGFKVSADGFSCINALSAWLHKDQIRTLTEEEKNSRDDRTTRFWNLRGETFKNSPYLYSKYNGNATLYSKELEVQIKEYVNGEIDEDPTDMSKVEKNDNKFYETICKKYGAFKEYEPGFMQIRESGDIVLRPTVNSYIVCGDNMLYRVDWSKTKSNFTCTPLQHEYGTFYDCAEVNKQSLSKEEKLVQDSREKEEQRMRDLCKGSGSVAVLNSIRQISANLERKLEQDRMLNEYYQRADCFQAYGYFLQQAKDGSFYIEHSGNK